MYLESEENNLEGEKSSNEAIIEENSTEKLIPSSIPRDSETSHVLYKASDENSNSGGTSFDKSRIENTYIDRRQSPDISNTLEITTKTVYSKAVENDKSREIFINANNTKTNYADKIKPPTMSSTWKPSIINVYQKTTDNIFSVKNSIDEENTEESDHKHKSKDKKHKDVTYIQRSSNLPKNIEISTNSVSKKSIENAISKESSLDDAKNEKYGKFRKKSTSISNSQNTPPKTAPHEVNGKVSNENFQRGMDSSSPSSGLYFHGR